MSDVPVLFNRLPDLGGKAVAITPDLANGAVYGSVYIAPDQFLHQPDIAVLEEDANADFQLDPGEDLNANSFLDTHRDPFHVALIVDQVLPAAMTVQYIDDWDVYHFWDGEVHCSSNEQRAMPATSAPWWEMAPP